MPIVTEAIGWLGSAIILVSLAQAQPRRLHLLNAGACLILMAYNALIGAVPGVALNVGLVLVNLWRLRALALEQQSQDQAETYQVQSSVPGSSRRQGRW